MVRTVWFVSLLMLALIVAPGAEYAVSAQEDLAAPPPGVTIETVGQRLVGEAGDDLVFLRVTIESGAGLPSSDGAHAAVILLEQGRVGVQLNAGEADLTLSGGDGTVPLAPGRETMLAPGDAVVSGDGAGLALYNAGDGEAILLVAAEVTAGDALFALSQDASGTFSVETFACPEGMSIATLESDACELSVESLVQWTLASDQFAAPLGVDEATVAGATTTWDGLPDGTYFVELSAETFAPGYVDYFIPSSNQVTRQDERMTRIYFNSLRSTDSINAYVFTTEPATGA